MRSGWLVALFIGGALAVLVVALRARKACVTSQKRVRHRAHVERTDDPAIFSFQWLRPDEMNELDRAMIITEAETLKPGHGRAATDIVPDVVSITLDQPQPAIFLQRVEDTLRDKSNVQIIYVSAHGLNGRVLFGADGAASMSYEELGEALGKGLNASDLVAAIFAMCEAGGADEQVLLTSLPPSIHEVYAFTGKPLAKDVAALLAGVLVDEMRLFEKLHQENEAIFGCGVREKDLAAAIQAVKGAFDSVLKVHDPEAEHYVANGDGRFVRHYARDEAGVWGAPEVLILPGRVAEEPPKSAI